MSDTPVWMAAAEYLATGNTDGINVGGVTSDMLAEIERLREEHDSMAAHLSAAHMAWDGLDVERMELRNPPPCKWQLDPVDCVYETGCGESWVFEGNAEENGVKFCPGCGHPVELTVMEVKDE